jgi:hypothetical protein
MFESDRLTRDGIDRRGAVGCADILSRRRDDVPLARRSCRYTLPVFALESSDRLERAKKKENEI